MTSKPPEMASGQIISNANNHLTDLRKHAGSLRARSDQRLANSLTHSIDALETTIDQAQTHLQAYASSRNLLLAFSEISQAINSTLDLDDVLEQVIDAIISLMTAERAFLMLIDEDSGLLRTVVARNWEQRNLNEEEKRISMTIVSQVLTAGEPVLTSNAHSDPNLKAIDSIMDFSPIAIVCVPLINKNEICGVIYADSRSMQSSFHEDQYHVLNLFSHQAAIAIENARLYEASILNAADLEKRVAERTAQLRTANTELKQLSKMKDEFIGNLSHELRTPVASLKLYASLLEKPTANSHKYPAIITREIERLEHLIEGLLRLSFLEQQPDRVQLQSIDLATLAEEIVSDRRPFAEKENLTLTFTAGPDNSICQGDPRLIDETISILLTNAINYSPPGSTIHVSTVERVKFTKRWYGVTVEDNGPGIPSEEQSLIFTRFYRGSSARDSRKPGTGLGLAIAREIMKLHNGEIEVFSNGIPGEGSCFSIWFPADKPR